MKSWEDRLTNLSYTDRDVSAMRTRLVNYLKENYPELVTDFNESSLVMMIIELLAGTGDMLQYRIDRQALESYLSTAKQRSNVKAILGSLGYRLEMATAATGTCLAQIPENSVVPGNGITVEKGTQLNAYDNEGSSYPLTVMESVLVPYPGNETVKIPVRQGILSRMTVKVRDIIDSIRLYLLTTANTEVDRNTVTMVIGGIEWTQVDDVLADYSETNTTFSVFEDKYDKPYIIFHRNFSELLSESLNLDVEISYLETRGLLNLSQKLSISSVNSFNTTNSASLAGVRFSELSILTGGSSRETIAHAKEYAPKVFKTKDRAVTLADFEALVGSLQGVAKVKALDWKSEYVTTPYQVLLIVAPWEGTELSETQTESIQKFLEPRMLSTVTLEIRSATYVKVDIEATIVVNGPQSSFNSIRSKALDALTTEFVLANAEFGVGINASNIVTLIETSDTTIDYVELTKPSINDTTKKDLLTIYQLGDIILNVKGRY